MDSMRADPCRHPRTAYGALRPKHVRLGSAGLLVSERCGTAGPLEVGRRIPIERHVVRLGVVSVAGKASRRHQLRKAAAIRSRFLQDHAQAFRGRLHVLHASRAVLNSAALHVHSERADGETPSQNRRRKVRPLPYTCGAPFGSTSIGDFPCQAHNFPPKLECGIVTGSPCSFAHTCKNLQNRARQTVQNSENQILFFEYDSNAAVLRL